LKMYASNSTKRPWSRTRTKAMLGSDSLFIMFLKSYILLCAFVLVFSLVSYFFAIKHLTGSVESYNDAVLEGISSVIDQRLIESERMALRLTSLGLTAKLAYMDVSNSDFYWEMTNYARNLGTLWLENDPLALRMYVYFKNSGIVAGPDTFYPESTFYGRFFQYDDLDEEKFFALLLEADHNMEYLPSQPVELYDKAQLAGIYNLMVYSYQINSATGNSPPGAVFFLIDTAEIERMLGSLELGDGGLAAILDEDGRVIVKLDRGSGLEDSELAGIFGNRRIANNGRMVASSLSARNGWSYLALGSRETFMRPVLVLRRLLAFLFAASVLGGVLIAFRMARRRSLPLARLESLLESGGYPGTTGAFSEPSAYGPLERGVESVLSDNADLHHRVDEITPLMVPAFLHRLFQGGFSDDAVIRETALHLGMILPDGPYSLVSFHALHGEKPGRMDRGEMLKDLMVHDAIRGCLALRLGHDDLIYERNPTELIWVYGSGGTANEEKLLSTLDWIVGWLNEHHLRVAVRFTRFFDNLADSWWESAQIQRQEQDPSITGSRLELAWQDPEQGHHRFFPLLESLLLDAYRSCDEHMINRIFDVVQREAARDDPESHAKLPPVYLDLLDSVRRIIGLEADTDLQNLAWNADDGFERLRRIMLSSSREAGRACAEPGSFLVRKIVEFTDRELFNPNLSLTLIADRMKISESYLCRVFKEGGSGTASLAAYIERGRIDAACSRLMESTAGIAEIAIEVGYKSDQVFRRAFRRVTGMSPNEFRQTGNPV